MVADRIRPRKQSEEDEEVWYSTVQKIQWCGRREGGIWASADAQRSHSLHQ